MDWLWGVIVLFVLVNAALIISALRSRRAFYAACERWDDRADVATHTRGTVRRGFGLGVFLVRRYEIEFHDIDGVTHAVRQPVSGPWLKPGAHIEVRYHGDDPSSAAVDPRRAHPTWRFAVLWLAFYPVLALSAGAALGLALLRGR